MKIVSNIGTDRVIDLLRPHLKQESQLDIVTPTFSLFAFFEMLNALSALRKVNVLLSSEQADLSYLGADADRAARTGCIHAGWRCVVPSGCTRRVRLSALKAVYLKALWLSVMRNHTRNKFYWGRSRLLPMVWV
jgi:hypothetical protein